MNELTPAASWTPAQRTYNILRLAAAMCFIGHGIFGILTKPIWCNYFAVFGIGHDTAYFLMPIVGSVDILMGLSLLIYPVRAIPAWLIGWGLVTASLRPLSGEPVAELIERAGNFGAPLALLLLVGWGSIGGSAENGRHWEGGLLRGWFTRIEPNAQPEQKVLDRVRWCLRIVVFLLLLGHGWLNLLGKKSLLGQYEGLGFPDPTLTALIAGIFEITAALAVLIRPARPLLLILFIWKMGTELFYPHYEVFEWIERGGSYGSLLALWMLSGEKKAELIKKTSYIV